MPRESLLLKHSDIKRTNIYGYGRQQRFRQLDVFTRTPLAGNPLAIFTDARGLTDQQMQALAREMNLSETTFILPREPELEATDGTRVRIFPTREELPFAGHPTLGAGTIPERSKSLIRS